MLVLPHIESSYSAIQHVLSLSALQQGEDVALPEVPSDPIPEVPEAAKAEPGIGGFISHCEALLT